MKGIKGSNKKNNSTNSMTSTSSSFNNLVVKLVKSKLDKYIRGWTMKKEKKLMFKSKIHFI